MIAACVTNGPYRTRTDTYLQSKVVAVWNTTMFPRFVPITGNRGQNQDALKREDIFWNLLFLWIAVSIPNRTGWTRTTDTTALCNKICCWHHKHDAVCFRLRYQLRHRPKVAGRGLEPLTTSLTWNERLLWESRTGFVSLRTLPTELPCKSRKGIEPLSAAWLKEKIAVNPTNMRYFFLMPLCCHCTTYPKGHGLESNPYLFINSEIREELLS